ncbi:hypothetical protein HYPSUDRAFT_723217 [Hypholoma sublateritium FD-334 SS-4]|uniref:Uncharacterized protein n=1 Tax=Hypholoma sublateritium (strain FD-334 SS-4) TaxID=945553 RepID=A0A0D2NRS3_HYPSF|nr:hypothetical protein HYPSUDRAFT_723217 [Hypholoma sublateritium FD-334 SS-4]
MATRPIPCSYSYSYSSCVLTYLSSSQCARALARASLAIAIASSRYRQRSPAKLKPRSTYVQGQGHAPHAPSHAFHRQIHARTFRPPKSIAHHIDARRSRSRCGRYPRAIPRIHTRSAFSHVPLSPLPPPAPTDLHHRPARAPPARRVRALCAFLPPHNPIHIYPARCQISCLFRPLVALRCITVPPAAYKRYYLSSCRCVL